MSSKEIMLSFSDLWLAFKKKKREVIALSLILGILAFCGQCNQPLKYKADGIFKGASAEGSPISLALEILGGSDTYATSEDPKLFLRSYPVLEETVRSLNLQATVIGSSKKLGRFSALKAEAFYLKKNKEIQSRILIDGLPVLSRPLFHETSPTLQCIDVSFPGEICRKLRIQFVSETTFNVFDRKRLLGKGSLEQPFIWDEGSFTLKGIIPRNKKCYLHFIPLNEAVKSLEKRLVVKRNKENPTLIEIFYTDSDRQFAAEVVNQAMLCYQSFLKSEGKKKIAQQIDYLQYRQQCAQDDLEKILEEHCSSLKGNIESGESLTLEGELEFMAKRQEKERNTLSELATEIEGLKNQLNLDEEIDSLPEEIQPLTLDSAKSLFTDYQCKLDRLYLEMGNFEYCLSKLSEPGFDGSSLSQILTDPALVQRFEKMHTFHRNLADTNNWSETEKVHLQEELQSEKKFLIKHIKHLQEGAFIQETVLKQRIHSLQKILIALLTKKYEAIKGRLQEAANQAAYVPQKWLTEKKIDINMQLSSEMSASITKMIEAKNIGYHLEYLAATPLKNAFVPTVPCPPKLCLYFLGGAGAGLFLACLVLIIKEIWLGPSGSYANLCAAGAVVCGSFSNGSKERDKKTIWKTAHLLSQKGKIFLLGSQVQNSIPETLSAFFAKRGEKVLLVNVNAPALAMASSYDYKELADDADDIEAYIGSKQCKELLCTLASQYERVFILIHAATDSPLYSELIPQVHAALYCLGEERMRDLEVFSSEMLYVLHDPSPSLFSISQVRPFLDKIFQKRHIIK